MILDECVICYANITLFLRGCNAQYIAQLLRDYKSTDYF